MGGRRRAAGGLATLLGIGVAVPAHAGPVRVLEAERMQSASAAVVRVPGGRALQLRPGQSARAEVTTAAVDEVVLRTRSTGCGNTRSLALSVDGGIARRVRPAMRWREQGVSLWLAPGPHRIKVAFTGARRERCRVLVDRLRLAAPVVARAPDVPPPATATRRVPLGTAVQHGYMARDPLFTAAVDREFASFTPENELKMSWVQPERGRWNFKAADELVAFGQQHGKPVRGHALVFGAQTPPWVKRLLLASEAEAALRRHIHTVVGRYKHFVREWDVVNEALDAGGAYRTNPWTQTLGPRYVELAFKFAREADPTAKLFYNEYEADTAGVKRDATAKLVRDLKAKGLIDGVGLQMHRSIADAPLREQVEESLRLYESMGLEVQITEMDVKASGDAPLHDRLELQAGAYRRAAEACVNVPACTRFTVWGVTDKYSWIGAQELPLLLDGAYAPKPALGAVRAVLG